MCRLNRMWGAVHPGSARECNYDSMNSVSYVELQGIVGCNGSHGSARMACLGWQLSAISQIGKPNSIQVNRDGKVYISN